MMKTQEKIAIYRERLAAWLANPEDAKEPQPADYKLTTPAERFVAERVRDEVVASTKTKSKNAR